MNQTYPLQKDSVCVGDDLNANTLWVIDCFIIHGKARGFDKGHGSKLGSLKECPLGHFFFFEISWSSGWIRHGLGLGCFAWGNLRWLISVEQLMATKISLAGHNSSWNTYFWKKYIYFLTIYSFINEHFACVYIKYLHMCLVPVKARKLAGSMELQ